MKYLVTCKLLKLRAIFPDNSLIKNNFFSPRSLSDHA